MTAATLERPLRTYPEGPLYSSPRGLYDFQEIQIANCYLNTRGGGGALIVWDTGMGKSHAGMRMATLKDEDMRDAIAQHDLTILLCERGKLGEWREDFIKFTQVRATKYHGTNRRKMLDKNGLPNVLITTYETGRLDLVDFVALPGKRGKTIVGNDLFEQIKDLKVLWVLDECAKLRNRTSINYKCYDWVFKQMRKAHPLHHTVIGMTATPIEKDWTDALNQGRLISPDHMPTITYFENRFVKFRDREGRLPTTYHTDRMEEFAAFFRPFMYRKRKSDPDVIDEFPKVVEEARHFEMGSDQQALYEMVEALADPPDGYDSLVSGDYEPPGGLWTTLRLIADHPAALIPAARTGSSVLNKMLVEELGEEYLRNVSSVKAEGLVEYLSPLVLGQGAKVVVFSFFGPTVLPMLAELLREKRIKAYVCHGAMTTAVMEKTRADFRADPLPCVLFMSDAGARGINLPEATYVLEYESALTYANRTQRLNRVHRIDSMAEFVHCMTFITDGTVEVKIIEKCMERNEQTDVLLGDDDAGENFMTAADRRQALQIARLNPKRRRR